jgi:hypothetical protein
MVLLDRAKRAASHVVREAVKLTASMRDGISCSTLVPLVNGDIETAKSGYGPHTREAAVHGDGKGAAASGSRGDASTTAATPCEIEINMHSPLLLLSVSSELHKEHP